MCAKILRGLFSQNLVNLLLVGSTYWPLDRKERGGRKTLFGAPFNSLLFGWNLRRRRRLSAKGDIFPHYFETGSWGVTTAQIIQSFIFWGFPSSISSRWFSPESVGNLDKKEIAFLNRNRGERKKTLCSCMGNTNADSVKKIKKEKGKHGNQSSFSFRLMR